ncbi:Protein CBG26233 [Caenorhabditis briggsae]|nr:Protein CBG26233 [Caenorhabditis briggsae]CAR99868.1 Protein CBG26233 [Caenorhabditis briggsae]
MDEKNRLIKTGKLHKIVQRLQNTQDPTNLNNPVPLNVPEQEELKVSKEEEQEQENNQNLENPNSRKRRAENQEDPSTPSTSAAGPSGTSPPAGPKDFKTLITKLENKIHVPDELNIAELVTNYKSWAKRNNLLDLVHFASKVFGFRLRPTYEDKLEQNLKQQRPISRFDKQIYLRIYNFLNDPELCDKDRLRLNEFSNKEIRKFRAEAINIQNIAFNKFKARQEEINGITLEEVKRRLRKEVNLEGIDCLGFVQEAKVSTVGRCTASEFANAICGVVKHFEWHVLEKKIRDSKPLSDHRKFVISRMHNWMNEFTDDEKDKF